MTTTIAIIETELKANNIPFTGINGQLPKMILKVVNDIKHFGVDAINNSTLGKGPKKIALELAEKDTRSAVIRNGKTILN